MRPGIDGLLLLLAQETYRIHASSGDMGDADNSPWCDRWETPEMAAASARLRESYERRLEPYRPILSAWLDEHDHQDPRP